MAHGGKIAEVRRTDDGYTLIELLTVTVLIAILAAIAIAVFVHMDNRARGAQALSDLHSVALNESSYLTEHEFYLDTAQPNDLGSPMSSEMASLTVETLNADGTINGNNSAAGFCATAVTKASQTFYYNSLTGGFTSTPCPGH